MTHWRTFMRCIGLYCLGAICWLSMAGQAWAQQGADTSEKSASPWVVPYILVIFAVGLGLLIVCKPSRRREKAKAEQ
ncbi:MAG: hypothetical protein U1E05_08310 [Patescibacteria group bacterium]|nr:hypothetical protein [Patescibacteria group bacterium]